MFSEEQFNKAVQSVDASIGMHLEYYAMIAKKKDRNEFGHLRCLRLVLQDIPDGGPILFVVTTCTIATPWGNREDLKARSIEEITGPRVLQRSKLGTYLARIERAALNHRGASDVCASAGKALKAHIATLGFEKDDFDLVSELLDIRLRKWVESR